LAQLNPHQDINTGQACEFCHDTKPEVKKSLDVRDFKFKGDIVMLCMRCHDNAEHPASKSHIGLPDEEHMARINIIIPKDFPLDSSGRLHCATCHDPHVGGKGATRGFIVGMNICPLCHKWDGGPAEIGEDPVTNAPAKPPTPAAAVFAVASHGRIVRQHLDAGRVQYTGMDINADDLADSIRVDRIKQTMVYFVSDHRQGFHPFEPSTLPEEERRFVPDVLLNQDIDGDEIADLLLFNRDYLMRYRRDERTLQRILSGCVYLGQPRGEYIGLPTARLSEEANLAILDKARNLVFPSP
jgi:hypothetical protein